MASNLTLLKQSEKIIHAKVINDPSRGAWFLTCIYGTPYIHEKSSQKTYISQLSNSIDTPWVIIGDLNITLSPNGRSTQNTSSEILDLINDFDLSDMGFCGNPFTWSSNKHGTGQIKSRLDRTIVNNNWFISYPKSILTHLVQNGSDHAPILLEMCKQNKVTGRNWKFFEHWLSQHSCSDEIKNAWSARFSGSNAFVFTNKPQHNITSLQASDISGSNTEEIVKLEKQIRKLNDIQASSNRQKARDHFYNDMDLNSKYFHIRMNRRKSRNRIDSLLAPDGTWCNDRDSLAAILKNHFHNIMTSSTPADITSFL
ncbi:uncharacterized protein LOC113311267 [Papaver somniferum]|uniref:uncharacterized protein LOC113311267 n=1 Tax=Papaver somniferum TaxID=3469 RepID=UPI000E6FE010|nr:uncharacterized protein LOC113311267 [Papaver somniferum]